MKRLVFIFLIFFCSYTVRIDTAQAQQIIGVANSPGGTEQQQGDALSQQISQILNGTTNPATGQPFQISEVQLIVNCNGATCLNLGSLPDTFNIPESDDDPTTNLQNIPTIEINILAGPLDDEAGAILGIALTDVVIQEGEEDNAQQQEDLGLVDGGTDDITSDITGNGSIDISALEGGLEAWLEAFQQMTAELNSNMMAQVEAIGMFFDAKHQLESQRIFQRRTARAHKDYHPSVQMCEIGTMVRDLANTERRSDLTAVAMQRHMIDRALQSGDVKTVIGNSSDEITRVTQYINDFCNIQDNAQQNDLLCQGVSAGADQQNKDINFTQTLDAPLSLDIDMLDDFILPDEQNIFALLDYIFLNDALPFTAQSKSTLKKYVMPYMDMRSIVAMRSVAQNSFANFIALKTAGPEENTAAPYLYALMDEMGVTAEEIERVLGERPSYYAQMEVLTKKIYQDPKFFANLYDKPANVKRIRAAMSAIKLMQDRDIHESMMRREMLLSMILELKLREKQLVVDNNINNIINEN